MNTDNNKHLNFFKTRTILIIAAAYVISMLIILMIAKAVPEPEDTAILRDTVKSLERSVEQQKTIADAVVRLSELAKKSGYELAVNDVIRDHGESMKGVKENLSKLEGFGRSNSRAGFPVSVFIVIAVQGIFVIFYVIRIMTRPAGLTGVSKRKVNLSDKAGKK